MSKVDQVAPAPVTRLPERGLPHDEILERLRAYGKGHADYKSGKTWSLVYYLDEEHTDFLKDAFNLYFSENMLNPMAFAGLKRMESEVVRMAANLLHGDADAAGVMTSGGTESCMLAVKTYRDLARAKRGVKHPEMIVAETVHVAFEKAAEYFGVKSVRVPVDKDFRLDVKAVARRINRRTVCLVGSAPCYPFGTVDPIEDLSKVAVKAGVPLHVDSCVGGFLLPFVEKLGREVPPFDFRVPGVTSMSADVHKYGYAAKGASVILYRNVEFLRHQIFIQTDWPGGVFASAGLLGTRIGGGVAAAWAVLNALGEEGYLAHARTIMEVTDKLITGINATPDLYVLGRPHMSVFAFASRSSKVPIYAVGDRLEARGWHVDRQQRPETLHCMVTPRHALSADQYLADLREAVEEVRRDPEAEFKGGAAMYGMLSKVPFRGLVREGVMKMMLDLYGPAGKAPDAGEAENPTKLADKAALEFLRLRKKVTGWLNRQGA